jgi:hypothetical protein
VFMCEYVACIYGGGRQELPLAECIAISLKSHHSCRISSWGRKEYNQSS